MSFALNEIEATAKKATRGACYPWGLAEEAAKATRWLCAQGLDGVAILAAALTQPSSPTAPLMICACFLDRAYALPQTKTATEVKLTPDMSPLLLLPFVAMAARQIGSVLSLSCAEVSATTDGTGLCLTGTFPETATSVTVSLGGTLTTPLAQASRATPAPDSWAELNRLAHRTYAPATEESRLRGAGAGLSDND